MTKQAELPGYERPKRERIERASIKVREIEDEIKLQTGELMEANAELHAALMSERKELEFDTRGRQVYVYQDGEDHYVTRLETIPAKAEAHKVTVARVAIRPEKRAADAG